ncbi:hypothetical protein [Lactiplantibacillus xiangfangensis]|uniref:hypothetical protein n=1 Tax=Lactiplantibacillus xiangfangensis TaxID=942150 RepID=UPI0012ECC6E3|nr:hypothetical protein [Lactiplantibacillus xiangfangensis]
MEIALQGATITMSTPILPINWFFLVMSPFMVIGDYIEKAIKRDYPMVNTISVEMYLLIVAMQVIGVTSFMTMLWGLTSFKNINLLFLCYVYLALNILTLVYGVISTLLGSVIGQLIFISMLLLATGDTYIPVLSSLMKIHFSENGVYLDIVTLILLVIVVLWSPYLLEKIDFNG